MRTATATIGIAIGRWQHHLPSRGIWNGQRRCPRSVPIRSRFCHQVSIVTFAHSRFTVGDCRVSGVSGTAAGLNYLTEGGGQENEIMYKDAFDLPHFAMFPLLDDCQRL